MLRHHADGVIYLEGFTCTVQELLAVYPQYRLPAKAVSAVYYPGTRSVIYTAESDQKAGPAIWPEAEHVLANQSAFQKVIEAARIPPRPHRRIRQAAQILAAFDALTSGQQTTLRQAAGRWIVAQFLQANPNAAKALGINIDGDEPNT